MSKFRTIMKQALKELPLFISGCLTLGSLWQIEISILNDFHDWTFAYLFTWIQGVNNWAARDFFYMLIFIGYCLTILTAYKKGYEAGSNNETS